MRSVAGALRDAIVRAAFRFDLFRLSSCWECKWSREFDEEGDRRRHDMCLCMRPSFIKELDDLDIAGISVACVTEAVWCDDYEEMGE